MKLRLITFLTVGAVIVGVGVTQLAPIGDRLPAPASAETTAVTASGYAASAHGSVGPTRVAGASLAGTAEPGVGSQTQQALNLDPATVAHVGSFALPSGGRHEVYRATSRDGWTCIIEVRPMGIAPNGKPLGIYGGGCSPGPMSEYGLKVSISGAGDVDAPGTEGISIVGIAGPRIGRIALRMSDGVTGPVPLNASNAFQYAANPRNVGTEFSPAAVVAFDAAGKEVNEKALG